MFLVGVGCVSAEHIDDSCGLSTIDNVTDEVISADDSIDDNLNVDENDALSGSRSSVDVNSWNGLRNAVNGDSGADVVNIQSSLTPGNQVVINHNVTIIGSSNTYIGGSSYNHKATYNDILFYSNATGLSITLKNIKFQNCGGNTLMKFAGNGTYVLDNCTFENITANGYKQVVVHLNEGTCNITDCTFEKCSSSYGTVSNFKNDDEPDAVHMYVYGTTFRNNYANVEPGAINNCGHLTVYDSTFEDNSAAMWAGAIHTHSNANATIFRSTFINNVAEWNGGALSTYSYLRVVNCTFTSNVARTDKGGGAIFGFSQGSRPYIIVENCDFDNNTAVTGNGGAIAIINGILVVDDSRFNDNVAGGNYGGAISSVGMGINDFITNVTGCRFINNSVSNMGGAIFAINMGHLRVYSSIFINDTATSGNEIAFRYTGKKTNKAFFTYEDNTFYGADNASGAIYLYNNNIVVVDINNIFLNTDQYVEPENETTPSVVPIPGNVPIGHQVWNASIEDVLGGSPLIIGDKIFVPKGQYVYCLNVTNGNVLWNVSSDAGYFHELALHGNVLLAPCAGDKLYMIDPSTGDEIQSSSNIIQASSAFAPAIDGNTIYVSSECGYGVNNNTWIAVVECNNGVYSYVGSILEIDGITYGDYALLSAPILWNNYLWVNTVNGLMRIDLATNTSTIVLANTVGKPVLGGDYLYVLTRNNHICGVNAAGGLVKTISVSGNVGSTLAISNDNATLYTVDANGNAYYADVNSNSASFISQVNPVLSELTVDSNGYLYVGDDAGILWVFNVYYDENIDDWMVNSVWAYNVSSTIYGTPVISNGVVYVGTIDIFYALNNPSRVLFSSKSSCMTNYQSNFNSNLLGNVQNEVLGIQEKYFNPIDNPTLKTTDFQQANTIYYLNEGTYDVGVINIGGKKASNGQKTYYDNITIKPNGLANVIINIAPTTYYRGISFTVGSNITFENIKIISTATNYEYYITFTNGVKNVYIKNCTFENISNIVSDNPNRGDFIQFRQNDEGTGNIHIENCRFVNCNASYLIRSFQYSATHLGLVNISNCIFENSFGVKDTFSFLNTEVYLENNTFDSSSIGSIIIQSSSRIYSDVFFNVLTESLILGEEGSIVAELVDDNGNPIYLADVVNQGLDNVYTNYLNFKINGEEKTPTFDRTTGLYTLEYTPTSLDSISVKASCSNIENLNDDNDPILVKAITDLSVNCSDSAVYGTEFKVNATLDSTISGENITFTVLNSTNGPVKSVNTTITNGFASYSFADLPAGDYTVVADYAGGTSFAPVSDSKAFTITQADSSIEINVLNDIIHVGDKINVKAVVPTGATGNVTFRLENSKTVNVSEVATFDGLSAGNYFIYAIYNGDANYKASKEVNVTIDVVKYDFNLKISADNITYGEALVVKLSTNKNFTGGIYVYIGELKQDAQIIDGVGNATFNNLTAADYFITANFTGDDSFYSDSANTTATVNGVEVPADKAISTNVPANTKSPTFSIKLDKDATGNFTVSIDNGKIVRTAELKDGAASITVADLAAGNHNISISYSGDGKYAPITQNTTLTIKEPVKPTPKVTKKATKIVAKKKTFKAKVKVKKYTITLKSGKTLLKKVKVTLKVKGKTYTATTNKKGKAIFKIKNLKKKGTYKAVIKFKGNKNYKATSKKVKIKVKK